MWGWWMIRGLWLVLKAISNHVLCHQSQNCFNEADLLWYCGCVTKSFSIPPHHDAVKDQVFGSLKATVRNFCVSNFMF